MDAAQLGQVQQQIHQELTAVQELVSVQQQQLAVLQQQLVQQAQQRPVASPASFTTKLPEFTGAGRVDLWARDFWICCSLRRSVTRRQPRNGVHGTQGSGDAQFDYVPWLKRERGVEVVPRGALQVSALHCGSETRARAEDASK